MNLSGSRTPNFLNTSAFPRTFLLFLKASLCFRTAEVSDSTTTTTSDVCKHHITATIYTKAVYTDNYILHIRIDKYLRDRQIQRADSEQTKSPKSIRFMPPRGGKSPARRGEILGRKLQSLMDVRQLSAGSLKDLGETRNSRHTLWNAWSPR